jgi:hypothetical protein
MNVRTISSDRHWIWVDSSMKSGPATLRYNQACFLALMVPLADPDARGTAAARALDVLRQAVEAGYGDARTLETDRDLDPLRTREDFRKLLSASRQKPAATR